MYGFLALEAIGVGTRVVFFFLLEKFFFASDKSLKDTLHKVLRSGYFDRAQTHPNGSCQEEEEQEEPPAVAEAQDEAQPSVPGTDYVCVISNTSVFM